MFYLCADTSSEGSLSLYRGVDHTLIAETKLPTHSQSETLLKSIEELLKKAQLSRRGLKGIYMASGPGSFTGLRIGLSTFKGMALVLRCPLYLLDTHEIKLLAWLRQTTEITSQAVHVLSQVSRSYFFSSSFQKSGHNQWVLTHEQSWTEKPPITSDQIWITNFSESEGFSSSHYFPFESRWLYEFREVAKIQVRALSVEEIASLTPKYGIKTKFD